MYDVWHIYCELIVLPNFGIGVFSGYFLHILFGKMLAKQFK
jgi:hypothetical protein